MMKFFSLPPRDVHPERLPLPRPELKSGAAQARRALGERAVLVLALLEALASLRGLVPPGLAHAAQLVPALAPASGGAM